MKDDEAKRRIDALELLRKSAMERYAWRAQVEWKLCVALWTALAAFIGAVLTGKDTTAPKMSAVLLVTMAGLVICTLHWWWLCGLRRAQHLDNRISFFFRDRMMTEINIAFPPEILDEIEAVQGKDQGVWSHWSHGFQLGVTVLLAAGAIGTVRWATNHAENKKPDVQATPSTNNAAKP